MKQFEAKEQAALISWAELMRTRYPELGLLFHIPNGGSRNKAEAANLKREGVKAGVPDLFLPVSRGGKHGLFIEMKVKPNKPTAAQVSWLHELVSQDYETAVCYSWADAAKVIELYLEGAL